MELSINTNLSFDTCECATCGVMFAVTSKLKSKLQSSHETFYCPNGHRNYYPGETQEEKLRRELKRKEQELADSAIGTRLLENKLTEATKKLDRIQNGVCPCCNRSFKNLKRHMATKHPDHTQTKK